MKYDKWILAQKNLVISIFTWYYRVVAVLECRYLSDLEGKMEVKDDNLDGIAGNIQCNIDRQHTDAVQ